MNAIYRTSDLIETEYEEDKLIEKCYKEKETKQK